MRPAVTFETPMIGPKVDWDRCLGCGLPMSADEERYRIEKDGKIGVGHQGCQNGEVLNLDLRS